MLSDKARLLRIFCLIVATTMLAALTLPMLHATAAPAQQTSWTLVWQDNFDGSGQPSSANWNYHVGNGFNPGAGTFDGWGNGEWEWYRPQNCYRENGVLVLKAEYNTAPTNIAGRNWYQFSCRMTTDTRFSVTYGAIEARIQLPVKYGTWPAFWGMGDACDDTSTNSYNPAAGYYDRMASNWSSCGEIDIMEHRNTDASVVHNLFWDNRVGVFPWDCCTTQNNPSTVAVSNITGYHTYRLEWTSTQLKWLVDGTVTKTQDVSASNMEEFRKAFHLILNVAISGTFTGNAHPNQSDFPLYMRVDHVRVYRAGTGPTPTPVTPVPTTPSGCTGDFTRGVDNVNSNTARVWFKPCNYTAGYVILHYTRPGLPQQNLNMSYNTSAARWEYSVVGITAGQTLNYQFTYQKNGLQYDSAWFSWVKP